MENNDRKTAAHTARDSHDRFMIRMVLWFIALCIVGFVACVILGMLKMAIQTIVIVAAVLMFLALLGWVAYEKIKNRIDDRN